MPHASTWQTVAAHIQHRFLLIFYELMHEPRVSVSVPLSLQQVAQRKMQLDHMVLGETDEDGKPRKGKAVAAGATAVETRQMADILASMLSFNES